MEFKLTFDPKPIQPKIEHHHRLMLVGSCFTEQIGAKFLNHKFTTLENPHGILFNPVSILKTLDSCIQQKKYAETDLFQQGEIWGSWDHHTRFSDLSSMASLNKINRSQEQANAFLKNADWLMLTLGSSFVYELKGERVVANCHKVPTDKFTKRLLKADEIEAMFNELLPRLKAFNPKLKIIFTISPVRHSRDGFVENNRSKANLINSVHQLCEQHDHLYYFPAYELVIDDLRDYRFYAEDMVHPNYLATQYVWEKFCSAAFSSETLTLMKEIHTLFLARNHKPFNPAAQQHQEFLKKNIHKMQELMQQQPHIDYQEEIQYLIAQLQT